MGCFFYIPGSDSAWSLPFSASTFSPFVLVLSQQIAGELFHTLTPERAKHRMAAEMNSIPSSLNSGDSPNGQEVNSESPMHREIIFLHTTLGGYLQVQYQVRNRSPFEEHKNIMTALLVTLFIYAFGLMAEFKLPTQSFQSRIVRRFSPPIGFLLVVLLLIILLPLLGLVSFIVWTLVMVDAMIKPLQEILQWLRAKQIITTYFQTAENGSSGNRESGSTRSQESGPGNRDGSHLSEENGLPV